MPDLADDQVAIPNGPTPQTHLVTHLDGVIPKAVSATFDGSGAGGPFLPTLIIAGKEGREVARIPAPEVAAGATAEVSWFPRGVKAAAAAGGGASSAWFFAKREIPQTIPAASSRKIGWPDPEISDPAVFSVTTHTVANDTVNGLLPGIYVAQMTMTWQIPQTFRRQGFIVTDFLGGAGLSNSPVTDSATNQTAANKTYNLADVKVLIPSFVPGEISVLANNLDSSNRDVIACYFSILYLSNPTLAV